MNNINWISTSTLNESELEYHDKQVGQYDKLIKENMEAALPGLIRNILKIDIVESEEIPDDVQHTKEREPDLLKRITDSARKTYILHLEFQVQNEMEMPYRMLEYKAMLLRKYKLPVKQVVFLIGAKLNTMKDKIRDENLSFSYEIINIAKLSYELFLSSAKPEEQILAILANFNKESKQVVLKKIVKRVQESSDGEFVLNRHFKHLRILAQLRNFEINIYNIMDTIETHFKIERDPYYQRGEAKAQEKVIRNLITKLGLTDAQIVAATETTINYVKKIRASIGE